MHHENKVPLVRLHLHKYYSPRRTDKVSFSILTISNIAARLSRFVKNAIQRFLLSWKFFRTTKNLQLLQNYKDQHKLHITLGLLQEKKFETSAAFAEVSGFTRLKLYFVADHSRGSMLTDTSRVLNIEGSYNILFLHWLQTMSSQLNIMLGLRKTDIIGISS